MNYMKNININDRQTQKVIGIKNAQTVFSNTN